MTDKRSFCIHAHFYQPTREDPFTGKIPDEPGATPYANWNERIMATCYQPNVKERNFSAMSFNIGPTLTKWMSENEPGVLEQIVQEDRLNETLYGAGNAIAQPYHHTILPLAKYEDKRNPGGMGNSRIPSCIRETTPGNVAAGNGSGLRNLAHPGR